MGRSEELPELSLRADERVWKRSRLFYFAAPRRNEEPV